MSDPIVITRELVKRGWSDFEPKLITGLLTGSVAAFIVSLLGTYGIELSSMQQNYIAVACFFIGGYLTPSTGTAVTKRFSTDSEGTTTVTKEAHTGAVVTAVTGPLPVQAPLSGVIANPAGDVYGMGSPSSGSTDAATQVLSPGAAFLNMRGTDEVR